jgi:ribosome recycling factor
MAYQFSDFTQKLDKAIEHITQDLQSLRTGKASPQLLDPVQVEAYGTRMKVNELANVSAPDATLLVISPWDKSILHAIERAVSAAQLNLNPVVDGEIIRIVVPPLTEERRKEMVKTLYQKIEAGKKMLRTVRQDARKEVEAQKGTGGVSEDDIEADLTQLEDIFKKSMDTLDQLAQKKEADLMAV